MLKIVFLDRDTLSPETVLRAPAFPHELIVHDRTTPDKVAERIATADIVISNKAPLSRASLGRAMRLKLIAVSSEKRDPNLPSVPTVQETPGLDGFVTGSYQGILCPA